MMKTATLFFILSALVSAQAAPMPFAETFDALDEGSLDAQNDWTVQHGTAMVQTNVVHAGKAVELVNASVSHALSSDGRSFWTTFWARCDQTPDGNPAMTNANASVAFFISDTRTLVVYSNAVPVELDVTVASNVWTRFDVYCDYDTMTWDLSVNKSNVAAGLPLSSIYQRAASVEIQNASDFPAYVDDLLLVDQEPVQDSIDSDGDSIPDWWEQKYFADVTAAAPTPSNLDAYIAGLSPSGRFKLSGGYPLQWDGQPSRRYSVYASTNLNSEFTFQTHIPWQQAAYTDLIHTNESSMFYRVNVELDH
jgi:hypothetical protein